MPLDRRVGVGRRPDAGGHACPHAARQDRRRARAAARRRRAVHQRPDRPDDGRRVRVVRGARRRQRRRAERADRLRRRPRVTPGTIAQELPAGFQRSEFLFAHGFVDRVVPRAELREELAACSRTCPPAPDGPPTSAETRGLASFRPLRTRRSRRVLAEASPADATDATLGAPDDRRRRTRSGDRAAGAPTAAAAAGQGRPAVADSAASKPAMRDAVWARVQLARNLRRPAHPRARRGDGRRLRRAARRPPVRRRRGDRRRVRPDRRPPRRRRRPAEGRRHRREHPPQLRDAPPRGLPQGDAGDGAGRAVRAAGRHLRRRPGRPPRPGVGGARHRRGDRPLDRADEPAPDADRDGHHRRGRLGRGAGDRRRRRRHRPRERRLFRDQPGGLRLDPVADRRRGPDRRRWRCG